MCVKCQEIWTMFSVSNVDCSFLELQETLILRSVFKQVEMAHFLFVGIKKKSEDPKRRF